MTVTPRPGYGPTGYTIQSSVDGQGWTTVATVTGAPADGPVTATLPATTARYLRLSMTGTHQGTGLTVQLAELTVTAG